MSRQFVLQKEGCFHKGFDSREEAESALPEIFKQLQKDGFIGEVLLVEICTDYYVTEDSVSHLWDNSFGSEPFSSP